MTRRTTSKTVAFAHSVLAQRRRSNIGCWKLSRRNGRRPRRAIVVPCLSARGHHDLRASGFSKFVVDRDGDHRASRPSGGARSRRGIIANTAGGCTGRAAESPRQTLIRYRVTTTERHAAVHDLAVVEDGDLATNSGAHLGHGTRALKA